MDPVAVGLDIGSSVIRAAEVHVGKDGRRRLKRYGQVGIPDGYVVDGEINNPTGVAAALKRLWTEAGFTTTKVVLGVSGPRVFVRQADVPPIGKEDLRSFLKLDTQELVPLAMEEASFDFSVLDPATPGAAGDADTKQRILLVAAHRDLLRVYATTLREAGLSATVMDAAPLALLRAVPTAPAGDPGGGMDVIVSIGADLTTVAVREHGVPRFIRSLTLGGAKLTESIANKLHVEAAAAERLKRGGAPGSSQGTAARKAMVSEVRYLAEEVRDTIDFFVSQAGHGRVDRLLITGGASLTEGLAQAVAGQTSARVMAVNPLAALDVSDLGYDDEQKARITAGATTAIGLALWATDAPLIRLSLLPEDVRHARRLRRQVTLASGGLAALVAVLGAAGAAQIVSLHSEQNKVRNAQAEVAVLNGQVSSLQRKTVAHSQEQARLALVNGVLQGDVDWTRLIGQLATVMPAKLNLVSFTAARSTASAGATSGTHPGIGTVTFSVKGTGGLPAVASWLSGLQSDPDLSNVVVSGISVTTNGGPVTFSSTADITAVAESHRSAGVNP